MDAQIRLRLALVFAVAVSTTASALLLVTLAKAAIDHQLAAHPMKTAMLCLFMLVFAGFGAINAVLYRRMVHVAGRPSGQSPP